MQRNISPDREHILQFLILGLVVFAMFFSFQSITQSQTDFYNNLWAPVHLLVSGESPYDTDSLQPELPALWMPMAVGFFSFLGLFEFDAAQQLWFFLNTAGLAVLLYLSMPNPHSNLILMISAFLMFFFPPTINHFALGQVSILAALSLFLAVKLIEKKPLLSAFFLTLGMVKPQIGIFVLLGISINQIQKGGFQRLFRYGLKAFLAALILSFPLFIAEPNWIPDFIASLQANTSEWMHPSILYQMDLWFGDWKYIPLGVLLLGTFWIIRWLWLNSPLRFAALWSLALTVLVTPYVWSWDFVLLLPIFVYIFSKSNWKGRIFLVAGYCLIWMGMAAIQLSPNFHNSRFWWAPLCFIVLSFFGYKILEQENKYNDLSSV